jgi:TonB-linked SusC/RagA family outer membrane protein
MKNRLFNLLFLTIIFASFEVMSQNMTVKGKVSEENGDLLYGVNVTLKGTSTGVITNDKGEYTISVKPGATLAFSYIGFKPQDIVVGSSSTINVTLATDANALSEVVVTALGISKEARKVGYAVTTVGSEVMTKAREVNVGNSLSGRVAGLNISGTSGGPGGSARILLRGLASFSAGSPLIVMNGVPIDNTQRGSSGEWGGADQGDGIGNLNPDDIENMTVLKGASASALYGARAANGVIMITTKSGKKGKMSVEYNANIVADQAVNNTDYQYVYGQGLNGSRPANITSALNSGMLSWGEKLDGASTIQFDGKSYPYSAVKDNLKTFYRTGTSITNSVSLSNGNDNGSFRLSFANLDNKSILRNSGLDRKTFNFNGSQMIGKKLKVDAMINYIDEKAQNKPQLSDGPQNSGNINFLATNVNQIALQPGYDVNSPVGAEIQYNDDIYVTNPWFVVNRYINNIDRKRIISAITAKYQITPAIWALGRLGYDRLNDKFFSVTPTGTAYSSGQLGGLNGIGNSETNEINIDGLVGFNKNFDESLSLDFTAGASLRKNDSESISVGGGPFVIPFFYSYSNVGSFNRGYGFRQKETQSFFYSADLSYNDFTLTNTGRYDIFSTLPVANNSVFTPSVSLSYNIANKLKMENLTYGKIRASYAVVSGEPTEEYITSQYYSVGSTINGTTTGSFGGGLPNLFLKPYTLTELEFGTELKFYKNKLGIDLAYFTRKTKNEIINGSLSPTTGYTSQYIGTGSTKNSGLEVLITGAPVKTSRFSWSPSFNITFIKNEIVEINGTGDANQVRTLGTYRPLNAQTALVKGMSGPQVYANDYKRDAAGNIIIDATGIPVQGERKAMGSVLPKVYGGLNNEFTFLGFDASFLIDYRFGNKVLSASNYYSIFRGLHKMTLEGRDGGIVAVGVTETGEKNTVSVANEQLYYQNLARRISALNVLDGSFIKLRQVQVGYTLGKKLFEKLPVESVNISFVARNLLTLLKHTDNIDPEAGFSSQINYAGIEGNGLPMTRTYGLNVNIKLK